MEEPGLQHNLPPSQVSVLHQDQLLPNALLVSFVALSSSEEGCGGELVPWQSVCSQPGRAQSLEEILGFQLGLSCLRAPCPWARRICVWG